MRFRGADIRGAQRCGRRTLSKSQCDDDGAGGSGGGMPGVCIRGGDDDNDDEFVRATILTTCPCTHHPFLFHQNHSLLTSYPSIVIKMPLSVSSDRSFADVVSPTRRNQPQRNVRDRSVAEKLAMSLPSPQTKKLKVSSNSVNPKKIPTEITPPIVAISSRGTACVAAGTAVVAVNDGGSSDALRLDDPPFLPHSSGLDDTTNIKYHYRVRPRKLGQCSIMSFFDSVQRGAPTPSEKKEDVTSLDDASEGGGGKGISFRPDHKKITYEKKCRVTAPSSISFRPDQPYLHQATNEKISNEERDAEEEQVGDDGYDDEVGEAEAASVIACIVLQPPPPTTTSRQRSEESDGGNGGTVGAAAGAALKSEIISDYKTMSAQKIAEKWHLTEGKPYFSESWPSVESCTSRYVRFIPIESRQLFYQRNVQVAHGISLTTRHLLRDYVKIILFYMRTPIKRDTPSTTNIYRTACPIKVNNSLNMRSDINRIHPNNFPIFRISPANAYLHKRIMRGLEGLTTELGRHQDDEFNIYFVKYKAGEGMGAHGDYGGLKAEKYHMMRISLGIGGSREIRFFAKEIDRNSKDDTAGTIVKDLGFQLVMSGCHNAYMMTHFGDGMTGLCLSDQHGTSVIRACHKVKMIKTDERPCVTAVISFPLRSIEAVATSLKRFRGMTIDLDNYEAAGATTRGAN